MKASRHSTPLGRDANGQVGSLTVELVLLTPVLIIFVLLAVALGRYELAREQLIGAARAAAEAASVAPSASEASSAASSAADPELEPFGHTCRDLQVITDTNHFFPGGSVEVTVICSVDFSDLLIPGLPGSSVVRVTEIAPIDPFRSVQ
jgi:hypothetical protein